MKERPTIEVTYQGGPLDGETQWVKPDWDGTVLAYDDMKADGDYLRATVVTYECRQDKDTGRWVAVLRERDAREGAG